MNNFKLMAALCMYCLLLISCQKEALTPDLVQEFNPTTEVAPLQIRVIEGIPEFKSPEHYFAALDELANLPETKLDLWEKSQGFTSKRSITQQALAKINAASSPQEATRIAQQYTDLIQAGPLGYSPKVDFAYSAVANTQGLYYIDNTLNTVAAGYHIALTNDNKEILARALANPATFEADGLSVTLLPTANEDQRTNCGDFVFDTYETNEARVVIVFASKTEVLAHNGHIFARSKIDLGLQADVWNGQNWVIDPSTSVLGLDIGATVNTITGADVSFTLGTQQFQSGNGFVRTYVGNTVMYPQGTTYIPETTILSAEGRAYSKRLGPQNQAVLNCD